MTEVNGDDIQDIRKKIDHLSGMFHELEGLPALKDQVGELNDTVNMIHSGFFKVSKMAPPGTVPLVDRLVRLADLHERLIWLGGVIFKAGKIGLWTSPLWGTWLGWDFLSKLS